MNAPMPIRTPVLDEAGLLSQPWVRWLASIVAAVPLTGTGSPLNVVVANIGTIYERQDGGAATSVYVKEAGNGLATGWIAK